VASASIRPSSSMVMCWVLVKVAPEAVCSTYGWRGGQTTVSAHGYTNGGRTQQDGPVEHQLLERRHIVPVIRGAAEGRVGEVAGVLPCAFVRALEEARRADIVVVVGVTR
jgi:hypothetical protein